MSKELWFFWAWRVFSLETSKNWSEKICTEKSGVVPKIQRGEGLLGLEKTFLHYFWDSSNNIEIWIIQLFFSSIFVAIPSTYWKFQIFCSAVSISVRIKFFKLPTIIRFSCDGTSEWQFCIRTPNSIRLSEQMFVRVLVIPDMLLLLNMKPKSKNNTVPRRGLFCISREKFILIPKTLLYFWNVKRII